MTLDINFVYKVNFWLQNVYVILLIVLIHLSTADMYIAEIIALLEDYLMVGNLIRTVLAKPLDSHSYCLAMKLPYGGKVLIYANCMRRCRLADFNCTNTCVLSLV